MDYCLRYKTLHEQAEIIQAAKTDPEIMGKVIVQNENLIWHSVYKFTKDLALTEKTYQIEKDDILQIGRVGMLKAIQQFDPNRGCKFSSFASPTVFKEVMCYFRDHGRLIRPTRTASIILNKISKLQRNYPYAEYMTNEEIADHLNIDVEKVDKITTVGDDVYHIEEYSTMDSNINPIDTIPDSFDLEDQCISKLYTDSLIKSIFKRLSSKERDILNLKINSGYNYVEIAAQLNLTHSDVSRAFRRIKRITVNILNPSKPKEIKRTRASKYMEYIQKVIIILVDNPFATMDKIREVIPRNMSTQSIYYIKKMAIQEIKKRKS